MWTREGIERVTAADRAFPQRECLVAGHIRATIEVRKKIA